MIGLLFEDQYKKTAKFLYEKLKKSGFNISNNDISDKIQIVILIFSKKSNESEKIIKKYNKAIDLNIPVIPFVITDLDYNLTTDFFLSSHDWINAFDNNLQKASDDLISLIKEITENKSPEFVQNQKTPEAKNNGANKKKNTLIIAIIAIFILIIGYFIKINLDNSKNESSQLDIPIVNSKTDEEILVGDWKLADYKDNIERSPSDLIQYQQSIEALKKNFLLRLKSDGTFEKYGFSVPEKGNWQYDPQNKIIYMWPPGSQAKDVLKIKKLTQDTLIFSIATKQDSLHVITTIFTLYK